MHHVLGVSAATTATNMMISKRTVYRISERFKATGNIAPFQKRHGPIPKIDETDMEIILDAIFTRPGIYLSEMKSIIQQKTGKQIHESTLCRTLHKRGFSRQKIRYRALQKSDAQRVRFIAEAAAFSSSMFVWIDETGFQKCSIARRYTYSVRGMRPRSFAIRAGGKRYSAIAAMSVDGVEDAYIAAGNVNRTEFLHFVRNSLLPILLPFNGVNPKSIVVMDNLSVNHCHEVVDAILSRGALVRFLPPYSPDLNPIEPVFSEVKQWALANDLAFQATQCPRTLITMAFSSVTVQNCHSYIENCGYM